MNYLNIFLVSMSCDFAMQRMHSVWLHTHHTYADRKHLFGFSRAPEFNWDRVDGKKKNVRQTDGGKRRR